MRYSHRINLSQSTMAKADGTPRQRRKIFPHYLDEADKASSDDASKSNSSKNDEAYDNAKSKKSNKQHPSAKNKANGTSSDTKSATPTSKESAAGSALHHLLPLPLVLTVLICSGLFWIASFRDVFATGKPILDTLGVLWGQDDADANFLVSCFCFNIDVYIDCTWCTRYIHLM